MKTIGQQIGKRRRRYRIQLLQSLWKDIATQTEKQHKMKTVKLV